MAGYNYAGFFVRLFALFVDCLIILYPFNMLSRLIFGLGGYENTTDWQIIPLAVIWSLYVIIMPVTKLQGTLGKALFRIKIINKDGSKISLMRSAGRYFSQFLSLILFIGYIMVAFSDRKTGFHDKLAKTYVVYKNKQEMEPKEYKREY